MKSPIKFAFFMAVPLEAANEHFSGTSVGAGLSFGGISLDRLFDFQFKVLHGPGLYASDWFNYIGFPKIGTLAIIASGYLDTVILLLVCIFALGPLFRRSAKRPPRPSDPTEVSE